MQSTTFEAPVRTRIYLRWAVYKHGEEKGLRSFGYEINVGLDRNAMLTQSRSLIEICIDKVTQNSMNVSK